MGIPAKRRVFLWLPGLGRRVVATIVGDATAEVNFLYAERSMFDVSVHEAKIGCGEGPQGGYDRIRI